MSKPRSNDPNPGLEIFQTSVSKAFYMIRLLLPPTRTIFRHPHVKDARSPEYFSFSIKKDNPLFFQNPQGQSHIQKSRVALLLKHQKKFPRYKMHIPHCPFLPAHSNATFMIPIGSGLIIARSERDIKYESRMKEEHEDGDDGNYARADIDLYADLAIQLHDYSKRHLPLCP